MTRDEIITRIQSRAGDIRALGADSLFLFGSAARDELRDDSDIDSIAGQTSTSGSRISPTCRASWKRSWKGLWTSRPEGGCTPG